MRFDEEEKKLYQERVSFLEMQIRREQMDKAYWQDVVGKVAATVPVGMVLSACYNTDALVKYFNELHAERDELKERVAKLESALSALNGVD